MARIVVPSREVYHLFAAQSQPEARNSSRSVWFRDSAAYSYGAEIARMHRNVRGERAVLIADRRWSITTSKHQSYLRSAVAHLTTFHVTYTDPSTHNALNGHLANVAEYLERITDLQGKAKRARTNKEWRATEALDLQAECLAYCAFFDLTAPASFDADTLTARRAEVQATYAAERAAREAAEVERVAAHDRKQAKNLAKWRKGEAVEYRGSVTALRSRIDSPNGMTETRIVETTHGASVPYADARILFTAWKRGAIVPGMTVGAYTVRSSTAEVLQIGCHTLTAAEIARFAKAQGWDA